MDRSGENETTYEYDKQDKPIFTNVSNITRTKNGNICVVDILSEDDAARVVVLNENGDVLNTVSGNSKTIFKPIRVFCTQFDFIVGSSLLNNDLLFYRPYWKIYYMV